MHKCKQQNLRIFHMNKFLILCSFIFGGSLFSMEWSDLNRQLSSAAAQHDISKVKELLEQGACVNLRPNNYEVTLLMEAAGRGLTALSIVLLEHGADVSLKDFIGETVFSTTFNEGYLLEEEEDLDTAIKFEKQKNEIIEALIVHSMFVPYYPEKQRKEAQKRTLTRLCVLRSMCPQMPRDVRYKILAFDDDLMEDAFKCPFGFHRGCYDHLPLIPYAVTKLLVRSKLLDAEKSVLKIKQHNIDKLRDLLDPAWIDENSDTELPEDVGNDQGNDGYKILKEVYASRLRRDNWEDICFPKIENAIKAKLDL